MERAEKSELIEAYITQALFTLMGQKAYNDISIKDIAEKAGVGRATFYRYFKSKHEILEGYFKKETLSFPSVPDVRPLRPDDYYEFVFHAFSRLKDNRVVLQRLMDAHLEFLYLDFVNEAMREFFEEKQFETSGYSSYYATGSLFNVSLQWIKNGCRDSVKRMADEFFRMLFHGLLSEEPATV